jgi:hypothetical protein
MKVAGDTDSKPTKSAPKRDALPAEQVPKA